MIINLTEEQKQVIQPILDSYYNEADDFMTASYKNDAGIFYEYYHGRKPEVQSPGGVPIIDRTCKTMVDSALKDLVEVFASNDTDAVSFSPLEAQDAYSAKAATKLVNQIFLHENNGYSVLADAIKEALITKAGFIKRYWAIDKITHHESAKDIPSEEEAQDYLQGLVAGGLQIDEADINLVQNDKGTFDLEVSYVADVKRVKVEFVPVEEILIDQQANSIQDAMYFCHRVKKSKTELLELGFTQEEVNNISNSETLDSDFLKVSSARNDFRRYADQDIGGDSSTDNAARVWVNEHYPKTALLSDDGSVNRYQVFHC